MKWYTPIIISVLLAMGIIIGGWLTICVPADTTYNREFKSHVTMAKDSANFEGMETQVKVLWENMNTTFDGYDFNTTYGTWWGPDQNYENSLGAQRDYFGGLLTRIGNYQVVYDMMSANGTSPGLILDWYDRAIVNLRNEMNRSGDLDWAIRPCYYYHIEPSAYWFPAYMCAMLCVIVPGGLVVGFKWGDE